MKNLPKAATRAICLSAIAGCLWQPAHSAQEMYTSSVPTNLSTTKDSYVYPHRTLTLHACFNLANSNNKEIIVSTSDLSAAEAAVVIARAIPNPTFNMIYGWGPAWRYIIAGNNQSIGWTEEIQIAGKRTKKAELARANYLQTAFQIEAVRFDVHNRVRRAYAELAAAAAYARLIDSQREIAGKLLDIAQKRFDAGKAPGAEVLQARLAFVQFDTQRNQARGRLVQGSAQLALLLGQSPEREEIIDVESNPLFDLSHERSSLAPSTNRELPPLEQLLPAAWRERKDLKAAVQAAYADRKALTLAKTQRFPDPLPGFYYLFSTYTPYQFGFFDPAGIIPYLQGIYPDLSGLNLSPRNPNPNPSLVKRLYDQSIASGAGANSIPNNSSTPLSIPDIKKDKVPFQPGYMITLQQEVPIFYQYRGQINQAKAAWLQQQKQNELLRSQIATDIVTAYEAVILTRTNIKRYATNLLPASSRAAYLTRRGYELGKLDLATAILAQQQYQQSRSAYFDAVVAYQNAWADLEKAVGVPLDL